MKMKSIISKSESMDECCHPADSRKPSIINENKINKKSKTSILGSKVLNVKNSKSALKNSKIF